MADKVEPVKQQVAAVQAEADAAGGGRAGGGSTRSERQLQARAQAAHRRARAGHQAAEDQAVERYWPVVTAGIRLDHSFPTRSPDAHRSAQGDRPRRAARRAGARVLQEADPGGLRDRGRGGRRRVGRLSRRRLPRSRASPSRPIPRRCSAAADFVLKVNGPPATDGGRDEIAWMRPGAIYARLADAAPQPRRACARSRRARSPPSPPTPSRAPRAPSRWTRSRRWRTSPATRACCSPPRSSTSTSRCS